MLKLIPKGAPQKCDILKLLFKFPNFPNLFLKIISQSNSL